MRWIIAFAVALSIAHAADIPQSSTRDNRIQYVNYHSGDVVLVHASIGYVSRIVFEADEIVLSPVHVGFRAGWDITANGRIMTIKPMSIQVDQNNTKRPNPEEWNTNIAVETNKRLYDLDLRLLPDDYDGKEYKAFFRVEFRYPIEAERQARQEVQQQIIKTTNEQDRASLPIPKNINYSMRIGQKSEDIVPTMAYDDGLFTYIQFPNNRDIPAVFIKSSDGVEGRINTHMHESQRNLIVVHRVARQMILRLGKSVVAIVNNQFDIDGIPPVNGTTVNGLVRGEKP